ncbi:MAG: acyl carrier protein [Sphaerochaetaceae bacterium]|nr:acyl carrier protein [Spirochaetales bacterium]MDY3768468.1 acyl carrier protein [Sphaerochaetaceae bacterium]MDY5967517.1 acyl carrier protein [Sphaerochaetaceae bacterium]
MTKEEIFEKLKGIIAEQLDIEDQSTITLESSFRKDLGADSLDTYELLYAIESEMNAKVEDEEANQFTTVNDVVEFIYKEQNK